MLKKELSNDDALALVNAKISEFRAISLLDNCSLFYCFMSLILFY